MAKRELTSILEPSDIVLSPATPSSVAADSKISPDLAKKLADITNRPRINILSDLPAATDSFGIEGLVRTVANIILSQSTQTPITIAIDGEWGSGKTSILKMLEAQARLLDFPCIWLNAWSLEDADHLFTSVTSEIQREIKSTAKYSKSRTMIEFTERLSDFLGTALSAIGATGSIGDTVAGMLKVNSTSREREANITELATIATTHSSFERLVDNLLEYTNANNPRLIVFVDDVDRAMPDQVVQILRNLKLILEMPKCVFLLAMDMEVVARAIHSYYLGHAQNSANFDISGESRGNFVIHQSGDSSKMSADYGQRFLEKLVQMRIPVPKLTRRTAESYLEQIGVAEEVNEIIFWAPDSEILNARRLKRYINSLSVTLQLILSSPKPRRLRNAQVLRMMALRQDYPEVYDFLATGELGSFDIDSPFFQAFRKLHPNEAHQVENDNEPMSAFRQVVGSYSFDFWILPQFLARRAGTERNENPHSLRRYLENFDRDNLEEFENYLLTTPILDTRRRTRPD